MKSKSYANCGTIGVVYLTTCTYGAFHIGKTKRTFARRVCDHLCYLDAGLLYTPICRYVGLNHGYDPSFISFLHLRLYYSKKGGVILIRKSSNKKLDGFLIKEQLHYLSNHSCSDCPWRLSHTLFVLIIMGETS